MKYPLLILLLLLTHLHQVSATDLPTQSNMTTLAKSIVSKGFIKNQGQLRDINGKAIPNVYFKLNAGNDQVYITNKGLTYVFNKFKANAVHTPVDSIPVELYRFDIGLSGAIISNQNVEASALSAESSYNYYLPGCAKGIKNVYGYKKIRIWNVYPGINWVIYATESGVKYEFELSPGVDPNAISLIYRNTKGISIMVNGALRIGGIFGDLYEEKPVSYQLDKECQSFYTLVNDSVIKFNIHNLDRSKPLRIDPKLAWGTLIGGVFLDAFNALVTDKQGNLYATGYSSSSNFPVKDTGTIYFQGTIQSYNTKDIIVSKFSPGGVLIWSTYYGGSKTDLANAIKADTSGNIFITGYTNSTDFPLRNNGTAYYNDSLNNGPYFSKTADMYLVELSDTGLVFSTYIGGKNTDIGFDLDIDKKGNIYLVGKSNSGDFPIKNGGGYYDSSLNYIDGVIMKFDKAGRLLWSTYFGGNDFDACFSVSVDKLNNVFVAGTTASSSSFPLKSFPGAYYSSLLNKGVNTYNYDVFISKFDSAAHLVWSTYYGGSGDDVGVATAVDNYNNLIVAGDTKSPNFHYHRGNGIYIDSSFNRKKNKDSTDVFVLKFNNSGTLVWGSNIGGRYSDLMMNVDASNYINGVQRAASISNDGCIADDCGNFYVGFNTSSPDLHTVNPGCNSYFADNLSLHRDAFIVKFSGAEAYKWGSYIGGQTSVTSSLSMALRNNSLYATCTDSGDYGLPYANPAGAYFVNTANGRNDIFLVKFSNARPNAIVNSALCSPGCTGKANAITNSVCPGGYRFKWSNDSVTQHISNLCSGPYSVIVRDTLACTADTVNFNLNDSSFTAFPTITPYSCQFRCDGTAHIDLPGISGVGYEWHVNKKTIYKKDTILSLCPGLDTVIVSVPGCGAQTIYFNEPLPPFLTAYVNDTQWASCPTACDGQAVVVVNGGEKPGHVIWSNGTKGTKCTHLCADSINTVTVTDSFCYTTVIDIPVGYKRPYALTSWGGCGCRCSARVDYIYYLGGGPFTYSWSNGQKTNEDTGLCPGTYTVIINSPCGADTETVYVYSFIPYLTVDYPPFCKGSKVKVSAELNDGGSGVTYKWSTGGTGSSVTGLKPGTYWVKAKGSCGSDSTGFIVRPASRLHVTGFDTVLSPCKGKCTGIIFAVDTGGVPPFHYKWSNGNTTDTAYNVCDKKLYKLTMWDACGDTSIDTIRVHTTFQGLSANFVPLVNTCPGKCTGVGQVVAKGGDGSFTFRWSNGDTTDIGTGLCTDSTYRVIISDGCHNKDTFKFVFPRASALEASTGFSPTCRNSCRGVVYAYVIGGIPPYKYLWSNGHTIDSIRNACYDTLYKVKVTDICGTVDTSSVRVGLVDSLIASISITSSPCPNLCNGTAAISYKGGLPPIFYFWSNFTFTKTTTGLCGDSTYYVIISDPGCYQDTFHIYIANSPAMKLKDSAVRQACQNQCNGKAIVKVSGGSLPITYLWYNSDTTLIDSTLCAGTNYVIATDACSRKDTAYVNITTATIHATVSQHIDNICYNACNGRLQVQATGATPPYFYYWNTGHHGRMDSNLCAGTYSVVIEQPGCTYDTLYATITQPSSAIVASVDTLTAATCFDSCNSFALVTVHGGMPPYMYLWSDGNTTNSDYKLCAGKQFVVITDSLGCVLKDSLLVVQPSNVASIYTDTISSHCDHKDGSLFVHIAGGTPPYNYLWNNGNGSAKDSALSPGLYTLLLIDSLNCKYTLDFTLSGLWPTVKAKPDTEVYYGSTVRLLASGTKKYLWEPLLSVSCDTCQNPLTYVKHNVTFCVTGIDTFGCKDTACIEVKVRIDCGVPFLPDAFTPNNDGNNDHFHVLGFCLATSHVIVYDRWGKQIFESYDQRDGWDGTYKNEAMPQDVYIWVMEATNLFGQSFHSKGDVTLIR